MALTFTPNIGLAKPTETELALNWARGTKLAEDNNLILTDKLDIGLAPYSPTFIGHTSNPNVGTGTIDGEYQDIEGYIQGTFVIECFDAGIAVGSGEYGISLPFVADGTYHTVGTALNNATGSNSCIGEAYIWDNSSVGGSGTAALDVVTVGGVSYARIVTENHTGKTSRVFRDSMPFALANNDKLVGNFFYKRT